ncbi:MAG: GHMP kinase [Candidatus Aminicenantes bacterium]|nr:GHMP kinase [Candidatus Aminicenantes bacterium]
MILARAPLRINDIGGWTDTWFCESGRVLNIAVSPKVEVEVSLSPNVDNREDRVLVHAKNYGEVFRIRPGYPEKSPHPLLQQTLSALPIPENIMLDISIFCRIPGGSSTGTSASVCVALIGALSKVSGISSSAKTIAYLAHSIETEKMGLQSGIQDQIAASFGGICLIDMVRYPQAEIHRLDIDKNTAEDLERRLCLIYLGRSHISSAIHEKVIAFLEKKGPGFKPLQHLKDCVEKARDSLLNGNLEKFGEVMIENNMYQKALHPDLISSEAEAVIHIAKKHGAKGWKVNGAGGPGGSLTLLGSGDSYRRQKMVEEITALGKGITPYSVSLSPAGLQVWET